MGGLTRKIRRAYAKRGGKEWQSKETPFRHDRSGYSALHPTKGWRRISFKRLEAQRRMAQLLGA